jgi:hypothetical protein
VEVLFESLEYNRKIQADIPAESMQNSFRVAVTKPPLKSMVCLSLVSDIFRKIPALIQKEKIDYQ